MRSSGIQVRRSLWRGQLISPKSRRSRRAIDLAPTLKAALARLPSRFKGEMVFTAADGGRIDPDNFINRHWARTLRRSSATPRFRRRSTGTVTSCPTPTR